MRKLERKKGGRPLYQQTADVLGEVLAKTQPGTFLPAEPALAAELGVSRSTLREAMRLFEARGLVVRRRGLGTYVAKPPQVIETGLEVLSSLETLAAQVGVTLEPAALRKLERPPTADEVVQFDLEEAETVLELKRVILADGRPVAYLVDCLPTAVLSAAEIGQDFHGSVLSLLSRRGKPELARSYAEISAVPAEAEVAEGLDIHIGDVVLYLEGRLMAEAGRTIDLSRSYFLPGTFKFHVVRRVAP